jgi:hypothetical protein
LIIFYGKLELSAPAYCPTYIVTKLGYSTDVFDLEPVLIQPTYIQCAEPSDMEIVIALRNMGDG